MRENEGERETDCVREERKRDRVCVSERERDREIKSARKRRRDKLSFQTTIWQHYLSMKYE